MWIDDNPKSMKTIIDDISDILKENYFSPDILTFESYEDFMVIFDTQTQNGSETFDDCDLLLVDYHIAQKSADKDTITGEILIEQLRKKGIFTEVVFYSNAMDEYRAQMSKKELDNVTYADKDQIVKKVEHLIKKSVRQGMNISSLRGYLMNSTSEFDLICKEVAKYYFSRIMPEQQSQIIQAMEKYIQEQYRLEAKKFSENNNKYTANYKAIQELENQFTLTTLQNEYERIRKLDAAFDSHESVMPTSKKFRLLAKILECAKIQDANTIYLFNSAETSENKCHKDFYQAALIKPRNDFAHNKLLYGPHCGKRRIKIATTFLNECMEQETCKADKPCDKSYSYADCLKLRENIYNYYKIFYRLLDSTKRT
jgi:hypothetical protein